MKRNYKKKITWPQADENYLLDLWEDNVDELRQYKKNGHIYKRISEEMCYKDMIYTPYEINIKVQNLAQKYRKERRAIQFSDGTSQSDWPLYPRIHQILGRFKMEDSFASAQVEQPELQPIFTSSSSKLQHKKIKRKKKSNSIRREMLKKAKEITKILQKEVERGRKMDKHIMKMEERRLSILDKHVTSNNELNSALIKYANAKSSN